MSSLTALDGTTLSYTTLGHGAPVVCLGGGPMQDPAYLGNLGGLSDSAQLIRFECRGTGSSGVPPDRQSYRCDRLVDDLESLRVHLSVDRLTVLAHCAGANLAVLYAARFPDRLAALVLITPSTRAVGLDATPDQRREMVERRAGEPWFRDAAAAFDRIRSGAATDSDWGAITPFTYGRWDDAARAHAASGEGTRNDDAASVFGSAGAFDPLATRGALGAVVAPVLVVAGALDVAAPPSVLAEVAGLFPHASFVIQPAAGHFPWLDDAAAFTATVSRFLG